MTDLFREIWQTLQHNKLRTALTGLAVAWGVFMLIVLLGVGNGVTNSFEENAMRPGSQKIVIWGGRTSKPYHGYREGRTIRLKNADIEIIAKEHSGFVSEVNSRIYGNSGYITAGTHSISGSYTGAFPSQLESESGNMKMTEGRFINDKDMAEKAKVTVISQRTAENLFPDGGALGSYINAGQVAFRIVGIYDSRWMRDIFIPYTTARMLSGNEDNLGSMNVILKDLHTEAEGGNAEQQVRQTLATAHDFNPDDESAVWLWNQFSNHMRGLKAMNILHASIWILGLLTLLSGVVGISNIMFVSVKERTHEIGIRRAIGAKPRSVLTQVIAESVAITTLFGYIGIVLGTAAMQGLNAVMGDQDFLSNATVKLSVALQVTAVLIIAGAMAGLFPALKALKIKPVEALRDE